MHAHNKFCLFYIISAQTIYIYKKFHEMNGAISKLSTFFIHPVKCFMRVFSTLMRSHASVKREQVLHES
jgi:hypothetical protein